MKKSRNLNSRLKKGCITAVSSLLCILLGLLIGFLLLLILDPAHAWKDGFWPMLQSGFRMVNNEALKRSGMNWMTVGQELSEAAPIIMTGLSVAFAFQTGLFNIGAAGQYVLGAFGAMYAALILHLPWYLCLLAATLLGALWGAIPGICKALLNINEVITCIMFNWIGLYAINTILYGRGSGPMYNQYTAQTYAISAVSPRSQIPASFFGIDLYAVFRYPSLTISIFLAVIAAILCLLVLNRTTFGYELKACGFNRDAAKYAGIRDKQKIVLAMVISGALAGFGAGLYYLSGAAQWSPGDSTALPSVGFDGISVALLASLNPVGCILSGLFLSHLNVGGSQMTQSLFPAEVANLISGVIIYLCAFSALFRKRVVTVLEKLSTPRKASAGTQEEKP
ncbi:MAG: ABC transporter permease [Lachnospiraceae bacterium]|nr:ABC transporter permease [Lachnospiraceae bacterium]